MGDPGLKGDILPDSPSTPLRVTTSLREPAWSRCSHSQMPCHMPRFSLPSEIGIVRDEPRKQAFTWAGMSSGPSQECLYGKPSGTILFSIISMSSLTSGSQLSFRAKLADVCRIWTWQRPTENWHISGICLKISSVTKWTPLCWGLRLSFLWNHADPIWIPLLVDEAMITRPNSPVPSNHKVVQNMHLGSPLLGTT